MLPNVINIYDLLKRNAFVCAIHVECQIITIVYHDKPLYALTLPAAVVTCLWLTSVCQHRFLISSFLFL